jgi:hypothetical protein
MAETLRQNAKKLQYSSAVSALEANASDALSGDVLEDVNDVAKEWDCSTRFIKDEARKGRLTLIRLSYHMVRMRRSEKLRYVREREISGDAA